MINLIHFYSFRGSKNLIKMEKFIYEKNLQLKKLPLLVSFSLAKRNEQQFLIKIWNLKVQMYIFRTRHTRIVNITSNNK